jgi:UDP-N-acetylenolpyruvoylglucosamine reductase
MKNIMEILKKDVEITNFSNFKTKAFTKYFFEINSLKDIEKLKEINDFALKEKIKILFIGSGTNMLFAFEKFD